MNPPSSPPGMDQGEEMKDTTSWAEAHVRNARGALLEDSSPDAVMTAAAAVLIVHQLERIANAAEEIARALQGEPLALDALASKVKHGAE